MKVLENVNVFCVSLNGVNEGTQFLTLVTCRPSLVNHVKRRLRSNSLPSRWEEEEKENGPPFSFRAHDRKSLPTHRRSLSADVLRDHKGNSQTVCGKCLVSLQKCKGLRKKKTVRSKKTKVAGPKRSKSASGIANCELGDSSISHADKSGLQCPGIAFKMDGYMLSYFIAAMKRSTSFRGTFMKRWSSKGGLYPLQLGHTTVVVLVALMRKPSNEVLDLLGNKMVNSNILYRRSLEHALSWLSTLGGAFSALGDLSQSWAEEAGHVSLTQLRIALRLGDPGIQSRCRLYAAISLLQRGYLKSCRDIVKSEYQYAVSLPEGSDPRLRRMCLGVWAKLQYHWKQVAADNKAILKSTFEDGLKDIRSNAKYWNVYDLEENRKIMPAVMMG